MAAVLGGGAALWGLAVGLGPLGDNSALTHLATGRLILEEGIPRQDPFSFTAGGNPWTVYSWLASAGMALADRAWDGHGIQVARASLTVFLAVLAWRLTRPAETIAGRVLAVTVVLCVGTGAWSERPLLVGLLMMAGLVTLAESDRLPPWLAVGIMWVWANAHGSFPLGLVYLAVRLVGRRIDGNDARRLRNLTLAALVGTLAGALNPLGPRLLVYPLHLLARHDLLQRVREWRSPTFSEPQNLIFLLAVFGSLLLCSRRQSWEDGLVAVVFGAAACLAVRNMALASIVLTPVLSRGLSGLGTVRGHQRSKMTLLASAVLVLAATAVSVVSLGNPAYDLRRYPVPQLAWMESRGLLDARVATQDFVGNLIIARRGREANVFFDDRYDLYPREVVTDAIALLDGGDGWQKRLDRHGIDVVLWERKLPLANLVSIDPAWQVVRRDAGWVVAVRRGRPL